MIGNNLKILMASSGITSTHELSKLVGIPQPTLHHILSGATTRPRKKLVETLAEYFSISPEQLMGEFPLPITLPSSVKENYGVSEAPILTWDEIKNWPNINKINLPKILVTQHDSEQNFALMIDDDRYEPAFSNGTTLIFSSDISPKDRNFALVYFKDDEEVLFAKIFIEKNITYITKKSDKEDITLKKIDPAKDKIIGILIESRIQY